MQIGFIGLGKMGTRMVEKLLSEGHSVVGWNRSKEPLESIKYQVSGIKYKDEKKLDTQYPHKGDPSDKIHNTRAGKFKIAESIEVLVKQLQPPRVIWMMLPAGSATQTMYDELLLLLESGDILIDGGNSFYKDTQRRFELSEQKGIRYLGIGVSGGIKAVENGYPFMVGGDVSAYQYIKAILDSLSKPNGGHEYFGIGGAGHFVKMVHNGIEYGMMQALGEGYGVLEKAPYALDMIKVAELWQKGTIVASFLNDCALEALKKDPKLAEIDGVIDATGEAQWTVETASEIGVPVENIDQSLDFRRRSQTDEKVSNSFAARMVASLRGEFGGHKVTKKS